MTITHIEKVIRIKQAKSEKPTIKIEYLYYVDIEEPPFPEWYFNVCKQIV